MSKVLFQKKRLRGYSLGKKIGEKYDKDDSEERNRIRYR